MPQIAAPDTSKTRPVRRAGDAFRAAFRLPRPPRWHLLCLAEIADFPQLRRDFGSRRASLLAKKLRDAVQTALGRAKVTVVGRDLIEIRCGIDRSEAATELVARIRSLVAAPIEVNGEPHPLSITLAAVAAPAEGPDDVQLAEAVEAALVRARAERKDVILDLTLPEQGLDGPALARSLPRAIAGGELFVQYQPKVHLRQQNIVSAEALVRWKHPQRGLILPGDFIGLAEESGEIGRLTLWTLRQVIADQRRLAARGHIMPVFINISGQLLADREFVETVCDVVRSCNVPIGFEITETSVIRDPEGAIAHLHAFDAIGIPLAIDDYGAGLSSLSYLKQLPARELKIDKMFVTQLTSSNRDPLIVRSTIDLAHALEMEVTAEGVETPAALALLSVMGCDMAQGYLISRPMGIDGFLEFLDEDRHLAATAGAYASFPRPESFWRRSG